MKKLTPEEQCENVRKQLKPELYKLITDREMKKEIIFKKPRKIWVFDVNDEGRCFYCEKIYI